MGILPLAKFHLSLIFPLWPLHSPLCPLYFALYCCSGNFPFGEISRKPAIKTRNFAKGKIKKKKNARSTLNAQYRKGKNFLFFYLTVERWASAFFFFFIFTFGEILNRPPSSPCIPWIRPCSPLFAPVFALYFYRPSFTFGEISRLRIARLLPLVALVFALVRPCIRPSFVEAEFYL